MSGHPNEKQREITENTRSVEQKLFEAFRSCRGVRLTSDDVSNLVLQDDSMRARISNRAALDAGIDEPGADCLCESARTWRQLQQLIKRGDHE